MSIFKCSESCSPFGMVMPRRLHEALYHISTLGIQEYMEAAEKSPGSGTSSMEKMRDHFSLRNDGHDHEPQPYLTKISILKGDNSVQVPTEERKKLSQQRKKSGCENIINKGRTSSRDF